MQKPNELANKTAASELPLEPELKKQIMLTSNIVWKHDLYENEIEKWLSNFTGEVFEQAYERQLALWLLANFVYYNIDEVRHLCKTLYCDFIHMMLSENPSGVATIAQKVEEILATSRFYYLGRPGESGAYILYYFRQENNLGMPNFISYPDDLSNEISTIVFIDDVTLSEGRHGQANYYIKEPIKKYFSDKKIMLLTIIATKKAIEFLEAINVTVVSSIILDERNKCFTQDSNIFNFYNEHRENGKLLAEHYGRKIRPHSPLGYNNSQFAFGFFYNTPDNSLPIFWSESNGWYPIIKRYDKKYDSGKKPDFRRFV